MHVHVHVAWLVTIAFVNLLQFDFIAFYITINAYGELIYDGRVWASRPRNVKPSILLKHHTKIALYMCDYAFAIQNMHCTIMRLYDKICRRNSSTASSLSRRLESTTRDCWIPCNLNMIASFTFPQIPNFSRAFNTCIIANKLHV